MILFLIFSSFASSSNIFVDSLNDTLAVLDGARLEGPGRHGITLKVVRLWPGQRVCVL